jgi:hypothetical protein
MKPREELLQRVLTGALVALACGLVGFGLVLYV